jgi:hypothetical protein
MKLHSVKIIGLKVLMVFDYDKMKIIEKGKITNLYQYVNNNLRTIYIVNRYGRLLLTIVYIHSKLMAFETCAKNVVNVSLFDVCAVEKNGGMESRMAGNNV